MELETLKQVVANTPSLTIRPETIDLLRMLEEDGESADDVLLRLILHYAFMNPKFNLKTCMLSERGRQYIFGKNYLVGVEHC